MASCVASVDYTIDQVCTLGADNENIDLFISFFSPDLILQTYDRVRPECAPGQFIQRASLFRKRGLGTAGLRPQIRAQGGVAPLLRNGSITLRIIPQ